MFIFGTRAFGRTCHVKGVCHVVTKFFHINFVPLVPVGSYVVIGDKTFRAPAVKVPLQWKSLGVAWLRFLCFGLTVFGLIGVIAISTEQPVKVGPLGLAIFTTLLGLGLVVLTYTLPPITRTSYQRAVDLAMQAKFTPAGFVRLEAAFGRITPEQAAAALEQLALAKQAELESQPEPMPAG